MFENKPKFGPETFPAGAEIIRQGDIPDKFYIITRGVVEVVDQPPDSLDEVIARLSTGDYFGEVGMLRRSRRMATVRAVTDVELMAMDYQTFRNWIESSPVIADEIHAVVEERTRDTGPLTPIDEPFGDALVEEDVETAAETAVEPSEQYSPGETIIRQGDVPDKFYIIVDGFVVVSHVNDKGKERLIAHLTSGDYFGEVGLLDGNPRIATVRALTKVKVVSFDRGTFRRWMSKSPTSQDEITETAERRRKDTGMLSLPDDES
jgi:cAMP-dependent protein kinase regulator